MRWPRGPRLYYTYFIFNKYSYAYFYFIKMHTINKLSNISRRREHVQSCHLDINHPDPETACPSDLQSDSFYDLYNSVKSDHDRVPRRVPRLPEY